MTTPGDYLGQILAEVVYASSFEVCVASGFPCALERVPCYGEKCNRNYEEFVTFRVSSAKLTIKAEQTIDRGLSCYLAMRMSVCPKSSPLNSSGSLLVLASAYAKQSP